MPTERDKYGMDYQDRAQLMAAQHNRCAICDRRFTASRRPQCDHHHRSGRVRGFICLSCNKRLGELHEDMFWLSSALDYLANPVAFSYGDWRTDDAPPEASDARSTPSETSVPQRTDAGDSALQR